MEDPNTSQNQSVPQNNPSEEDLSYASAALYLDKMIGNCKKCLNRRYLGYNRTFNHVVKCSCLLKFEAKVKRARLAGKPVDEIMPKM